MEVNTSDELYKHTLKHTLYWQDNNRKKEIKKEKKPTDAAAAASPTKSTKTNCCCLLLLEILKHENIFSFLFFFFRSSLGHDTIGLFLNSKQLNDRFENVVHAAVATRGREVVEMLAYVARARTTFANRTAKRRVSVELDLFGEKQIVGAFHYAVDDDHFV